MFGIKYLKTPPTTYIMQYRGGKVVREGAGLSFYYYSPRSTIVNIPLASNEVPFAFNEVTADFQDATIQGELTYRIADPGTLSTFLDYSLDARGRYRSDDPAKLGDRLIHPAQILTRGFTQRQTLRELLVNGDALVEHVLGELKASPEVAMLGVEILDESYLRAGYYQ